MASALRSCVRLAILASALAGQYEKKCDEIVAHSKRAGGLYNSGHVREAHEALADAERSFKEAKAINPQEPQAYLSMATTMLNAQKFDEALKLWKEVTSRVPDGPMRRWVKGRARWTRYGKVSTRRDKVYSRGQGNLTKALQLVEKQLEIYPQQPTLHHDLATIYVMLSALEPNSTANAVTSFRAAQQAAFEAWRAGVRKNGGTCCETCGGIVYDWQRQSESLDGGALVKLDFDRPAGVPSSYGSDGMYFDDGAYVAQFENVGLAGDDGVIVDDVRCQIYMASAGPAVHLSRNLQMLEIWGGPESPHEDGFGWHDFHFGQLPNFGKVPKPPTVAKAASVVQFAAVSYFHFMIELLGRLLVLKGKGALDDPETKLIVPLDPSAKRSKGGKGFVDTALNIVVGDALTAGRVIRFQTGGPPDVRVRVGTLFYADWRAPADFGVDGSHCATPRSILRSVRAILIPGDDARLNAPASRDLVYISREGQDMRGSLQGESLFRKGVNTIAKGAKPQLKFKVFSGGTSLDKQIALFQNARAIVGVHGGALTNILFCQPDVDVFEIGFQSPMAGHYRHLAVALGLRITLIPLVADDRGLGAREVKLQDTQAALAKIRSVLGGGESVAATDEL